MEKNRNNRRVIHCIAWCTDCGKRWENFITARANARRHAEKTGHKVHGEIAFSFQYNAQ